jgi:NitT/TauT family transport system substrate-binding protein
MFRPAAGCALALGCLAAFALSAFPVGCGGRDDPNAAPTLRVGYVGHDHQLALYVAALVGEDLSKTAGVHLRQRKPREVYDLVENGKTLATLNLVKVGGAANLPNAMASGQVSIGLGGVAPVAKFVDRGSPMKILAPLQTEGDQLVLQSDSPIDTWDEFVAAARQADRPIRIGYKGPVAVAKLIFMRALKAENIPYTHDPADTDAKVLLVHMMKGSNAIPMLAGKTGSAIDGFVMNQPVPAKAEHLGLGKVVAQLRNLPPAGAWKQHPCCCVAANEDVMATHPQAVKAFLKVIVLATRRMRKEPSAAIEASVEWTKSPLPVEKRSVPTITYLAEPTAEWRAGLVRYYEMMLDVGAFKGRLKDATGRQVADACLDTALVEQAFTELRAAGELAPSAE